MIAALVGSGVVGDYKDSATIVPWWSFTKTVIAAAGYDPRWVYHGLLIGPLCEAALLLHRLMTGSFLPPELISDMLERSHLGGSQPGRPWDSVGYGLGLMIGTVNGKTVTGHSGVGPGSTIAVYHASGSTHALTGAAFNFGADEGAGEFEVLRMLDLPRS
jgi:hypothetical protein